MQYGRRRNDGDLVLEYWVHEARGIKDITSDSEWVESVLKDGADWLGQHKTTIRIGCDMTHQEYGAVMNVTGTRQRSRVSASFD